MTGLAIAALATGVVYIFITMEGGEKQKRRKRRNYELDYGHDSYYQGINVFIIDDLYWDQYFWIEFKSEVIFLFALNYFEQNYIIAFQI